MAKIGWGGNYNKVLRRIDDIGNKTISVGIVRRTQHRGRKGVTSTASIYFWNDQGTRNIPKRETLKPAINAVDYSRHTNELMSKIVTGNHDNVLKSVGVLMVGSIKSHINDIKSPPLSPVTIARRINGGNNPLVDTRQLINSIDYKIE
jgi:hypothetical protein